MAGFTLVELLIVMGVILAIASMSVFAVTMFLREDRMSFEGKKIEALIREQREKARTTRLDRRLIFDFVRRSILIQAATGQNVFPTYNPNLPGTDDTTKCDPNFIKEEFLGSGMWFEKAIILKKNYTGGDPYFPEENVVTTLAAATGAGAGKDTNTKVGPMPLVKDHINADTTSIRLRRDGTIGIEKYNIAKGVAQESLSYDVPTSAYNSDADADIIIALKGEKKRLLIDIRPLSGTVESQVTQLTTTTQSSP